MESIASKIRKLLALSKSSNEHEAAAAAAAAKAQELLALHNLSITEVEIRTSDVLRSAVKTTRRTPVWVWTLAGGICKGFDVEYYKNGDFVVFLGLKKDLEVATWAFEYLYKTIFSCATEYISTVKEEKPKARASFSVGMAYRLSQRLVEQRRVHEITPLALVPVKSALIKKELDSLGIRTVDVKNNIAADHYVKGLEKGGKVPLSKPLPQTRQKGSYLP